MKQRLCPFCNRPIRIVVCDDEGNIHGKIGCEYEKHPYSGLQYGMVHDGYCNCLLSSDGDVIGGVLFHNVSSLIKQWDMAYGR